MNPINELSIYFGSDAWEPIKKALQNTDRSSLTSDELVEVDYFLQAMADTEEV